MSLADYINIAILVTLVVLTADVLTMRADGDFIDQLLAGLAAVLGALLAGAVWPLSIGVLIVAGILRLKARLRAGDH